MICHILIRFAVLHLQASGTLLVRDSIEKRVLTPTRGWNVGYNGRECPLCAIRQLRQSSNVIKVYASAAGQQA
jgi:hypothetical protein